MAGAPQVLLLTLLAGALGTMLGHNRASYLNDVENGDGREYGDSQHRVRRSEEIDITDLSEAVECRRNAIGKGEQLRVLRELGGVLNSGRRSRVSQKHRRRQFETRLFHARETEPGDFPFQALVLSDKSSICSGALISRDAVLTAAQCVYRHEEWVVQLGSVNLLVQQEGRQMIYGERVETHPDFSSGQFQHDIAIIFLKTPAVLNTLVQIVRLPTDMVNEDLVGVRGIVAGWGRTDLTQDCSQILLYAPLVVNSDESCSVYFSNYNAKTSFCAGGKWGASICNGDNGSPFSVGTPEGYVVLGVASFVFTEFCLPDFPTGFTRVTAYLDWISQTAGIELS